MRDIQTAEGPPILIIDYADLFDKRLDNVDAVKTMFESCRAHVEVVLVLVSTKGGASILPKWLRSPALRPTVGRHGNSYWIMEKDPDGKWIQ